MDSLSAIHLDLIVMAGMSSAKLGVDGGNPVFIYIFICLFKNALYFIGLFFSRAITNLFRK